MKIAKLHNKGEIFHSIQGEGINVGLPSVFVRSSFCNLHCVWCDTDYTWNWLGTDFMHRRSQLPGYQKYKPEDQVIDLSVEEVVNAIIQYSSKNVVITGGEPMLHQEDWVEMMGLLRLKDRSYTFEVETNGTISPTPEFDQAINQYNVSPKLENSENSQRLRENPQALSLFAQSSKAYFKFVVATVLDDIIEILNFQDRYSISNNKILLMPEATSVSSMTDKQLDIVNLCLNHGFRYTDRLHIRVFGEKRGT